MKAEGFEPVPDHRARGFGSEALSPVGNTQPVAELRMFVGLVHAKADASVKLAIGCERDRETRFRSRLPGACLNEVPAVLLGVGVRNAQGGGRNLASSRKAYQVGDVGGGVGTQGEARGLQRIRWHMLEMMIRVWSISFATRQRVTQRQFTAFRAIPKNVSRSLHTWGHALEDQPKSTESRYCMNSE